MSLLTTAKTLLLGVSKSPKDGLLLKVTVLRARDSTQTDHRLYHCLEKRLNELSRESRIDWSNKLYESFWLGSPDDRGESVKSFTKLVVALFPPGTKRRNYLSYPAKTEEDLLALLEHEIFGVIVKQLSRKVELDDTTAFTILNRMAEHGYLTSLHVLNKLIEVGSRKDSKRTRAALFEFKNHVSDKLQYTEFGKKALSKLEALFGEAKETTAQLPDEPPDVKWITWNSVTRIVEFYQDISSEAKLGDNHLKALKNWAVQAVTTQGDVGHKRFMELKALFKANPDLKNDENSSLFLEYEDLTHHGWTNYPPFLAELTSKLQNNVILLEIFRSLNDAQLKSWFEWHKFARGLKSTSAPSQKWLGLSKNLVKQLGKSRTIGLMVKLLDQSDWPPRVGGNNENTLRALIYATTFLPPRDVCTLLARFAEKCCYQTVKNLGIRNEKLGNACLWALINRKDGEGVSHLNRLFVRVKYPKVRKKIGAALDEAAAKAGLTRGELEELSIPDHGLDAAGLREIPVGDGFAQVRIAGTSRTDVKWRTVKGEFKSAIPLQLKDNKKQIQIVRLFAKEIETDLSAQVMRLQRIWLEKRNWPAQQWRERYNEHPLLNALSSRLIWNSNRDGARVSFVVRDGKFEDIAGSQINIDNSTITLWHPVECQLKEVVAWRARVQKIGLIQPFKQAHREVYLVTPAEMNTNTYSNRFAGHILKQHQTMALARLNGWNATHRINADTENDAPTHLVIPAYGLVTEYWTEGAGGEDPEMAESGAYLYISTDQVRFYRIAPGAPHSRSTAYGPTRGDAVSIMDVPSIVLSEVMRHCDLFVGVASVANDPNWRDGGANAAHPNQWRMDVGADYWTRQSFGELDQASSMRADFLNEILPSLAIGPRCKVEGRFLHVKGKLRNYKIHIGSGNILMSPNDAYLCIVPSRSVKSDELNYSLPFEGDGKLSLVLSKAIMLAADDKISDQTIVAQIKRK